MYHGAEGQNSLKWSYFVDLSEHLTAVARFIH